MLNVECSWDEAFKISTNSFERLNTEQILINNSNNRILASSVSSLCDLPAYETAAMDGWVVNGKSPWKKVGEINIGTLSNTVLKNSECLKISTGSVIPKGGEAVIPWEKVTEKADYVEGEIALRANCRPKGEECKTGDLILLQGTKINPPTIGLLAATGHDKIEVIKKPKIGIFFLGDELSHAGVPSGGAIRDALGVQLPALLEMYGAEVLVAKFVKDDLNILINNLKSSLSELDMIITTGGTADGPKDFVKPAIDALNGEYLIDRVRVRPAYHVILAKINTKIPFLALPGNPQSAIAAITSFGRPIVNSLLGTTTPEPLEITIKHEVNTPENFAKLIPGNLENNEFYKADYLGSAMLRGLAGSKGFALINPGLNAAGAKARWLSLPY